MSQAIKSINTSIPVAPEIELRRPAFINYLPVLLPIIGAFLLLAARKYGGPSAVPQDGPLVIWALLSYIFAAAALTTNFWAPVPFLQRLGLWTAAFGFFCNLAGWLIRWVTAGDRESWIRMTDHDGVYHSWWFFSYIPFSNLYDLSLAFAFGAAGATLLVSHRPNTRFVGALSFPLIALVLLLAVFIGSEFINLPPVLDSYWRPIHVGIASLSYGVALVSFALAVVYLLKDGVKAEAMGLTIMVTLIAAYITVWLMGGIKAFDPFTFSYRLNPGIPHAQGFSNSGARVALPGAGLWMTLSMMLLFGMAVCFALYLYKNSEKARHIGHWLLRASLATQAVTIGTIFYRIKTMGVVGAQVGTDQYYQIGNHLLGKDAAGQPVQNIVQVGANFMAANAERLVLDVRSNPVELAGLVTILVVSVFIMLFSFRTAQIRASLPALEKLDHMIYKTVGVAFAGIAILLVTGAVWANESWGKYWSWDSKEVGALVAWLAYAGYLHTRIAHGWSGRRSAYFALIGFLLVIFTYLGVSYILPGLHSYA